MRRDVSQIGECSLVKGASQGEASLGILLVKNGNRASYSYDNERLAGNS